MTGKMTIGNRTFTLGKKLYMSKGSEKNLKLTTTEDIEIFKALLQAKKDEWMH